MILDDAVRAAWDAYALEHFKLKDTVPTESELAGNESCPSGGTGALCSVQEAAGNESILLPIATLAAIGKKSESLRRALPVMLERWRVTHEAALPSSRRTAGSAPSFGKGLRTFDDAVESSA